MGYRNIVLFIKKQLSTLHTLEQKKDRKFKAANYSFLYDKETIHF